MIALLLALALLINLLLSIHLWRAYMTVLWQREYTVRAVERITQRIAKGK